MVGQNVNITHDEFVSYSIRWTKEAAITWVISYSLKLHTL